MLVDFWTMVNYIIGFMLIIIGIYIYFKPREAAKRFAVKLTDEIPHIKNVVGAGEMVRDNHFIAPTTQSKPYTQEKKNDQI